MCIIGSRSFCKGFTTSQQAKRTLQACKHLAKFAANLCRKVEYCRSTKLGRHFEISWKLCALLVLKVCAKGAQHHNKQKTTLQACKHLAKFVANLCRKVEYCRSTKLGRHFEISWKLCALLDLDAVLPGEFRELTLESLPLIRRGTSAWVSSVTGRSYLSGSGTRRRWTT